MFSEHVSGGKLLSLLTAWGSQREGWKVVVDRVIGFTVKRGIGLWERSFLS